MADALLGGVLPTIYSKADELKRGLINWLRLPTEQAKNVGSEVIGAHLQHQNLMKQAFGDPTNPYKITDPVAMQQATEALMAGPLGFAPVGMMIGPESKLWNAKNAFEAAKLEKQNISPQEIWQKTGTAKGLDNYLRQEIPDNRAFLMGGDTFGETVMNRMKALEIDKPTVKDILWHPDFLEAYPQLGNIEIQFTKKGNPAKAEWLPTENIIRVNADLPSDQARNSLLHELQHAVQREEVWNTGADASSILQKHLDKQKDLNEQLTKLNVEMKYYANKPEFADKYQDIMRQKEELARQWDYDPMSTAMKEYKAYGGEAEARLTQAREKMSKEERAKVYPFAKGEKALDIDPESALIRLEHNQPTITRKELLQQQLNKLKD